MYCSSVSSRRRIEQLLRQCERVVLVSDDILAGCVPAPRRRLLLVLVCARERIVWTLIGKLGGEITPLYVGDATQHPTHRPRACAGARPKFTTLALALAKGLAVRAVSPQGTVFSPLAFVQTLCVYRAPWGCKLSLTRVVVVYVGGTSAG